MMGAQSHLARPQIVFRVDSGRLIGSGHVMRCLVLAGALAGQGAECSFLCRSHDGNLGEVIERRGYPAVRMPVEPEDGASGYDLWRGGSVDDEIARSRAALSSLAPVALLVFDHYGIDYRVETALRDHAAAIAAFDDLFDKTHDCDFLIDQNLLHEAALFDGLVPDHCLRLVGGNYAPIAGAFAALRDQTLARRRFVARPEGLLVAMGGYDADDITSRVLTALRRPGSLDWVQHADIVLSSRAPHLPKVREAVAGLPNVRLHVDTSEMATLVSAADLAIGGAGVSQIERAVLGLPTAVAVMADNQRPAAALLEQAGATLTLGEAAAITPASIAEVLNRVHDDPALYQELGRRAAALSDGQGLGRILAALGPHLSAHFEGE